jgi:dipeptidyl aminopeptidase/acylaminoacyl peptidase
MKMKNKLNIIIIIFFSVNVLFAQQNNFERVKISRDDIALNGMIFPVRGEGPCPVVLLLYGFLGGESDIFSIGEKLQESGILTLTFNYSGTYGSEGEYSMENTPKDIDAAFDFLITKENVARYNIDTSKFYLGGYSYGGGMVLTYAANNPQIKAIFSIAGTDHGEFFREYFRNYVFAKMIDEMFEQLKAPNGPVRFMKGKLPKETTQEEIAGTILNWINN